MKTFLKNAHPLFSAFKPADPNGPSVLKVAPRVHAYKKTENDVEIKDYFQMFHLFVQILP